MDWTFNLDATFGTFGFGNSLYRNPRPDASGDLGDNWNEGTIKAGLGGVHASDSGSEWYGKLSAVGEGTFSSSPTLVGGDSTSFGVEDLYVGWRSGGEKPRWDFTVGRAPYKLGHGMLLYDGASEGGSRGGYWTNARKAFELAGIARFKPGNSTIEAFYLDRDELPESDSGSKLWGLNYEYAIGEDTTLGATYMSWSAKESMAPQRDGLDVYNLRAFTAPFPNLKQLSFELEYALEDNGVLLDSTAYNALAAWQFEDAWKLKLSYRYAFFEGDDPNTVENEAFDGLFTGFYDWSTWWQGEIAGGYLISNSNLISNQLRLSAKPTESISTGLIFFDFKLDQPLSFDPLVTSDDIGTELDWYMDWTINGNFTMSFVAAVGEPGECDRAVERPHRYLHLRNDLRVVQLLTTGGLTTERDGHRHESETAGQENEAGGPRIAERVTRPFVSAEEQEGEQDGVRDAQREARVIPDQERDCRGQAGNHHQPEAGECTHEIRLGEAVGLDVRGAHLRGNPRVQGLVFRFVTDAFEKVAEFVLHHRHSGTFIRRAAHGLGDATPFTSREQLIHDVHRRVDDAPGDVAADERDQKLACTFATFILDDDAGAQREGERHDEAEHDLAQARGRIEIAARK